MENIQQIIEGGAIGLAVLALLLVAYLIKLMFKFFGNHIRHNTTALTELKEAIHHLKEYLKNGK